MGGLVCVCLLNFFFICIVLQLVLSGISDVLFLSLFVFVMVVSREICFELSEQFVDLLIFCPIFDH